MLKQKIYYDNKNNLRHNGNLKKCKNSNHKARTLTCLEECLIGLNAGKSFRRTLQVAIIFAKY